MHSLKSTKNVKPASKDNEMSKLLEPNHVYKPFFYPWAYDAWQKQQQIHWLPEEVPLADDVKDWRHNLTDAEKSLLTQIFRFFTQADIEVNNCYMQHYSRVFGPTEVKMMLAAFSNMETIHVAAYSHLLDTVGMPEVEYQAFMKYKEMKDKFDYMQQFNVNDKKEIAKTLAVFGAFTEGLQLFASFAMLLSFPRFNKMKGMGQIVTWSVRDETLHCMSIIKLFRTFIEENREIWNDELKGELYQACRTIVEHEDAFIDLAFSMGDIEGLTASDVKQYIRHIADRRLVQLGLKPNYGVEKNPLPWIDELLNAPEMANFFEQRVTEYSKAATTGDWADALTETNYVIFGQQGCKWCEKARNLMELHEISSYTYVDMTHKSDLKKEVYEKSGQETVPVIYRDNNGDSDCVTLIGGYTDLEAYLKGQS